MLKSIFLTLSVPGEGYLRHTWWKLLKLDNFIYIVIKSNSVFTYMTPQSKVKWKSFDVEGYFQN
jgi:hypothetical protein